MSRARATTIGNFDGVHRGHLALLCAARQAVGRQGIVTVLAFDPHPISVLRPGRTPARLTTWSERRALLEAAGADEVVRLTPEPELLACEPVEFLHMIVKQHRPDVIVEGEDFHFGRARRGSVDTLRQAGPGLGFDVVVVPEVDCQLTNQSVVRASSSMLRWLIERGRVADAASVLDRPYTLTGTIEQGDQRGRELGFPTANINAGDLLLPADGIYSGWARRPDGSRRPAAISIGTKPTFGVHARTCEAYLLGFDGPLNEYGWAARFEFDHWLREQITCTCIEQLTDQINRDIARVQQHAQRSTAAAL